MKKKTTYSVTFFDKNGDWANRDEDIETVGEAREHASKGVMGNHHRAVVSKTTEVTAFNRTFYEE